MAFTRATQDLDHFYLNTLKVDIKETVLIFVIFAGLRIARSKEVCSAHHAALLYSSLT